MPICEGNEMELQINPELQSDKKLHILVTHDETVFYSKDGKNSGWALKNE